MNTRTERLSKLRQRNCQLGVTLVELMIGLVVGLIVLSGVLYTFLLTYSSSKDVLNSTRLNVETSALLDLMTGELRRSGHWYVSVASSATSPYDSNPYLDGSEIDIAIIGTDCVLYRYDVDGDADYSETSEFLGFKREVVDGVGVIKFRKSGGSFSMSDCAATGDDWETVSDEEFMDVTGFSITDQTTCLLGPAASSTAVCGVTSDDYAQIRDLIISVTAEVIRDPDWKTTLNDSVRIRNNIVKDF